MTMARKPRPAPKAAKPKPWKPKPGKGNPKVTETMGGR